MSSALLVRSLEIASDYLEAAGPTHPLVPSMIVAMDAAYAVRDEPEAVVLTHLAVVVDGTQALADDLGLPWRPMPVVRSALGRG